MTATTNAKVVVDNVWDGVFEDGGIGWYSFVIQADDDAPGVFAWGLYSGTRLTVVATGSAGGLDAARSAVSVAATTG